MARHSALNAGKTGARIFAHELQQQQDLRAGKTARPAAVQQHCRAVF